MEQKTIGQLLREKLDLTALKEEKMNCLEELTVERIEIQKDYAKFLLKELGVIDPDVMLAGGAPRDWDNGKAAKDLDIYIQGKENESSWSVAHRVFQVLSRLDLNIERVEDSNYGSQRDNGISAVYNLKASIVPVQIVICEKSQEQVLELFDCSTSKIYMRQLGYILKSDEYVVGKKYKTYFLRIDANEEYKERIRAKFPDYKEIYVL